MAGEGDRSVLVPSWLSPSPPPLRNAELLARRSRADLGVTALECQECCCCCCAAGDVAGAGKFGDAAAAAAAGDLSCTLTAPIPLEGEEEQPSSGRSLSP